MKQIPALALILAAFWLINSGHLEPFLLGLGALSVAGIIFVTKRMERVDGLYESPVILSLRLPGYLLWLFWEIVKSNLHVIRRIWQREPDISPVVFNVKVSQKSEVCKVLYANSITMTPGTITLDIDGDEFEVHALTREAAEGVMDGEMDRRVTRLED